MAKPVRIGLVGLRRGLSHNLLFQNHPQVEVAALCDIREKRARQAAAQWGVERIYTDYQALLEDPRINAVYIATPDHLHGEMNVAALRAGKHVLSEIPLATDVAHCRMIVDESRQRGLKVQMGNECRWMPYLEAVKGLVDRGELGELFYGEGEYLHNLQMEHWRQEEEDGTRHWRWDPRAPQTTMLGGGPHALDTLRWLMGIDQFTEVVAFGTQGSIATTPADDTTVALFRTSAGKIVKITVCYGMWRPYCLYFSVYGKDGSFEASRDTPQGEGQVFLKGIRHQTAWMALPVPYMHHPGIEYSGGHGTTEHFQGLDFIEAILKDRQPAINAREGAISCAALICALEAARSGQKIAIPQF